MLHSLMSLSSPVPEFGGADAKRLGAAKLAHCVSTLTGVDPILDTQQAPIAEQPLKEQTQNNEEKPELQKAVRTSKSGPGRKPIEVVEQESELTRVTYDAIKGNTCAVFQGLGIIDDYMASDNLNECVDALLEKKSKAAFH